MSFVCSRNLSELLPNGGANHPRALHSISATLPPPIAQPPSLFSSSFHYPRHDCACFSLYSTLFTCLRVCELRCGEVRASAVIEADLIPNQHGGRGCEVSPSSRHLQLLQLSWQSPHSVQISS